MSGRTTRSANKDRHPGQIVLDAAREEADDIETEKEAYSEALRKEAEDIKKRLAQIERKVQKEDERRRAPSVPTESLVQAGQKRPNDLVDADSDTNEQAGEEGNVVDLGADSEPELVPIRGRGGGRGRGRGGRGRGGARSVSDTVYATGPCSLKSSDMQAPKTKPPSKKQKSTNDATDSDADADDDTGVTEVNAPRPKKATEKAPANKAKAQGDAVSTSSLLRPPQTPTPKLTILTQTPKPANGKKKKNTLQTEVAAAREALSSESELDNPRYAFPLITRTLTHVST